MADVEPVITQNGAMSARMLAEALMANPDAAVIAMVPGQWECRGVVYVGAQKDDEDPPEIDPTYPNGVCMIVFDLPGFDPAPGTVD